MSADYFLKLEGIEGECLDSKHKGELEVDSFSVGALQPASSGFGTGAGSGKVQMQDLTITTRWTKASPKLMVTCATGKPIETCTLTIRKAGEEQQEYGIITLSNAVITSYNTVAGQIAPNVTSIIPTETFTLSYSKINFEYKEQKDDGTLGGSVKAGWNVKENKTL